MWHLLPAPPPEITGEAADPNEAQAAPEKDAGELNGLSPEDPGLIAPLLDWLASWFTLPQPPVAAADGPEITGEAAAPNGEQTAAEKDWLPTWFTPAQQLAGPAADAPEITEEAPAPDEEQTAAENHAVEMGGLSEEDRGLLALLNMDQQGNVFVGQWQITDDGEARRVPSRVVMLEGPELLAGGLTALERRIFQEREVDWQTYAEAAVDLAAIASGVALLRFARTAGRGMHATRGAAGTPTVRSGALEAAKDAAKVLGVNAMRYGLPIGVVVLMVLHPAVFTQYLWLLAESLGMPGIIGPLIGWGIAIVPLAFLLSWMLLSARLLRFAGWLLAGAAFGCRRLAVRLAVPDRPQL